MRSRVLLLSVVLAAPVAGLVALRDEGAAPEQPYAAPPAAAVPLTGLLYAGGATVVRLDPVRLRPLRRRVPIVGDTRVALSPDGRELAVAGRGRIDILRAGDLRRRRTLARPPGLTRLLWLRRDRVLELSQGARAVTVRTVDPRSGRAGAAARLDGQLLSSATAGGRLVAVLAPAGRRGPARLVIVDGDAAVRSVPLAPLTAGASPDPGTGVYRERIPALAVVPSGVRALVIPPDGPVADVDLRRRTLSWRTLHRGRSLSARVESWLVPEALAKSAAGAARSAVWVSPHVVAVTGVDHHASRERPAGLTLIDTRSWRTRLIEREASSVDVAAGLLLATGPRLGLAAYGPDGRRRFHVLAGQASWLGAVVGTRALVVLDVEARLVDLRSGRVAPAALDVVERLRAGG